MHFGVENLSSEGCNTHRECRGFYIEPYEIFLSEQDWAGKGILGRLGEAEQELWRNIPCPQRTLRNQKLTVEAGTNNARFPVFVGAT
jgi:hypothetical protein